MSRYLADFLSIFLATNSGIAGAQDMNAVWNEVARTCAQMNEGWDRPTEITRSLLHQGHSGVRRCINDSRAVNELPDVSAILNQARDYRENGGRDFGIWIAKLEPLVSRSLAGVEAELYTLYRTGPLLPDRDAQLLRWTLAYAEKKPLQAYVLAQGYQAGKWGVPKNSAAAAQVLRRGAVSGCVACMKALINGHFNSSGLYDYNVLTERELYKLAPASVTDEEREILLVLLKLVDGGRESPLVLKTNEESRLDAYLVDASINTSIRQENRILRDAARLINPNNPRYGFDVLAADHFDAGLLSYTAVSADVFRKAGATYQDTANSQGALVKGEYRVKYLDEVIRYIDALPAAERANNSQFRSWLVTEAAAAGGLDYYLDAAHQLATLSPRRGIRNMKFVNFKPLPSPMLRRTVDDFLFLAGAFNRASEPEIRSVRAQSYAAQALLCVQDTKGLSYLQAYRRCNPDLVAAERIAPNNPIVTALRSDFDRKGNALRAERQAWEAYSREQDAKRARERAARGVFKPWRSPVASGSTASTPGVPATISSSDAYRQARERGVRVCQNTGGTNCQR